MKSISSNWFFATVKLNAVGEDGTEKRTTKQYVVDAMSFTECEARLVEEVSDNELEVVKECKAPFTEVFFSEDEADHRWYKVKVKIITLDERTGKEKKSPVVFLVQAKSNETASNNMKALMADCADYELADVIETSVVDVLTK